MTTTDNGRLITAKRAMSRPLILSLKLTPHVINSIVAPRLTRRWANTVRGNQLRQNTSPCAPTQPPQKLIDPKKSKRLVVASIKHARTTTRVYAFDKRSLDRDELLQPLAGDFGDIDG